MPALKMPPTTSQELSVEMKNKKMNLVKKDLIMYRFILICQTLFHSISDFNKNILLRRGFDSTKKVFRKRKTF